MAISPADRPLRIINILALIPTLALTVPTSVLFNHAYFGCISIPCIFSAILGLALLHPRAKQSNWIVLLDTIIAFVFLGMLIPYFVGVGEGWGWSWRNGNGTAILATFGSFCPLLDFGIHSYFALRPLAAYMVAPFGTRTCPHCQGEVGMTIDPRLLWDLTPGSSGRSSTMVQDVKNAIQTSVATMVQDVKGTGYAPVATSAPAAERDVEAQDGGETPRASTDDETARLVET